MLSECKAKIGVISLGCAKNLVDTELMLGLLGEAGYETCGSAEEADVILVNTCAFIESAKEEAINTILEMAEYKKSGCRALVVTGCLAERYSEDIRRELPEVDAIVGINNVGTIVKVIDGILENGPERPAVEVGGAFSALYMNGPRRLSTPEGSAYLKIAEGCDNRCTFCAIPGIRGPMRSRRLEDIAAEAARLASAGVKELNVIAQDTTRYGRDIYGKPMLAELLKEIEAVDGIESVRVLYTYPEEFDDKLISELASLSKFAHYIDLPLQHINAAILRRMGRRGSPEHIRSVISKLRAAMPDCILRTSFIVGFPGETEEAFGELMQFVGEYKFDRVGVFTYSLEEGTPAARLRGQIPEEIKRERYERLYSLAGEISFEKNRTRVGSVVRVLTEGVSEDGIFYEGRSYAEAPDSDGKIFFTSDEPLAAGDFVNVELLIAEEYDLTGRALNS